MYAHSRDCGGEPMSPSVLTACLLALPWCGAAAVWCVRDTHPRARDFVAVAFSIATALVSLTLLPQATSSTTLRLAVGGAFGDYTFVPDALAMRMAVIATTIGALSIVFSLDYMQRGPGLARYYALLLVFIGAMVGLVLAGSLLVLLVFWEIVGLCSCALIAFRADESRAVSGALRALVVTQVGGIGLLAGILATRTALGTDQVADVLADPSALPPAALTILAYGFLVAACAKSAQFPFHTWLPGAMEAPTPVSALIHAATMVNAGVYLLLRFAPVLSAAPGWSETVIGVGVVSAVLAALMAVVSTDLKRVLAYSTISQLGFLFYAVGLNAPDAAQFHMLSHALFKGLLFLCAGAVIYRTGTRDLERLGAIAQRMPVVTTTFLIGALALAGVPILNGFWTKEMILDAGFANGPVWASALIVGACGLTARYATRLTWRVFFRASPGLHVREAPVAMRIALVPLAVATTLSWLLIGRAPIVDVVTSPATVVGLAATIAGGAAWFWRHRFAHITGRLAWVGTAASADFGLVSVERAVRTAATVGAAYLQATQTGRLSWNLAALFSGLTAVLAVLAYEGAH